MNNACPECKSVKIISIIYGKPDKFDYMDQEFITGGCMVKEGAPIYYCVECSHRWGSLKIQYTDNDVILS